MIHDDCGSCFVAVPRATGHLSFHLVPGCDITHRPSSVVPENQACDVTHRPSSVVTMEIGLVTSLTDLAL